MNRVHRTAAHPLLSDSWISAATKPVSKTRYKKGQEGGTKTLFFSDEHSAHKDAELLCECILSHLDMTELGLNRFRQRMGQQ